MSRHRNFRKMNYDDELGEDDEEFHRYSISADDEGACPATEEYMYRRPQTSAVSGKAGFFFSDFIPEEGLSGLENDVVVDSGDFGAAADGQRQQRNGVQRAAQHGTTALSQVQKMSGNKGKEVRFPEDVKHEAGKPEAMNSENGANGQSLLLQLSELENLRLSEAGEKKIRSDSPAANRTPTLTSSASSKRLSALDAARSAVVQTPIAKKRANEDKPSVNLVIVGHVDAGKSTLMGHLLYQLGGVDNRTMHKYKQESAKTGKASFAYAWVLDDTQEERERGVTMDIARTTFETEHRKIAVLDAPGHKDFIPNMITGAAQADAGILVINATRGEFETGFDQGGQTREHSMLLRSLGVGELIVAINKLDTIEWSQQRYNELCTILKTFLKKQAAFSVIKFVPLSGLDGVNLTKPPSKDHPLHKWYQGSTLVQAIDELSAPVRSENRPFRAVINDIFKMTTTALSISAKIEAGFVENGEKVYIMPNADPVIVKAVSATDDGSSPDGICFAGDQASMTLTAVGNIEPDSVSTGHVLCRGGQECLIPGKKFLARIVVFNILVPIIKGTKAELFAHSLCEPCTITRLKAELNKSSGAVVRNKPRALTRHMSGMVEIETERAISLEAYSVCKALGRVTLRSAGQTIAAGIIESRI